MVQGETRNSMFFLCDFRGFYVNIHQREANKLQQLVPIVR